MEVCRYIDTYDVTLDVCLPSEKQQAFVLNSLTQLQEGENIDVCLEDETFTYSNRKDVQQALHAKLVGISSWSICSGGDQDSVIPLLGTSSLVNGLAREFGMNTTVSYRAWFKCSGAGCSSPLEVACSQLEVILGQLIDLKVAGWTQVYGDILTFATIRGAAHEAPFSQPERSLVSLKAFLDGKPLPTIV